MPQSQLPRYRLSSGLALVCFFILLGTTAFNVAFTLYNVRLLAQLLPPQKQYSYIGDDYPAQLPIPLAPVGLALENGNPHFSLYDDAEWGTLFPSDGFTTLGPNNRTFLLSMIHQLHCLDIIRVGFVVNGTNAAHHIEHCLRYLRQVVLCYADTTLEVDTPVLVDGKLEHAAGGEGMVHRCKDWTAVRSYLEENPASDYA